MTLKHHKLKNDNTPLFEVKDLSISFRTYRNWLRESIVQVVNNLNLTINAGKILAVVGASGSGKSLLANAILGILPENATLNGTLIYKGEPLNQKKLITLRGKEISLVPQSVNALDPLIKAGKQVQTVVRGKDRKAIQQDAFDKVGLPLKTGNRYPFELSGGMARRVLVSTAIISEANFIIADEPTPGLDELTLQETINSLKQLAKDGKGILLITHDIHTALKIADKIAVFYAGQTVEIANAGDFSGKGEKLRHPYTKALWNALPQNDFFPLVGSQPSVGESFSGCTFASRCPIAMEKCANEQPKDTNVAGGMVKCFHA
ncbi:ABC transporter ATP-binding protein [Lentibacillus sp. Marseille-P4043]|uniref:ABC transporter ATP-binding protein n=1 Tax=Lentibacillus sp. Marseille-P4043 TaxID=2040293 RepID=UPI000D0BC6D6|nr:ABC transporter ATP-binding protein [Lentibacillus sp. Marseille-P4043]